MQITKCKLQIELKIPESPFPTTGYFGPVYFCDREDELAQLKLNIKGGNSTTLVALRRLGETSTVLRSLNSLQRMELIYRETGANGKSFCGLYDILFWRWVAGL